MLTNTKQTIQDPAGVREAGRADQRDRGRDKQGAPPGGGGRAAAGGGQAEAGAAAEGAHRQAQEVGGQEETVQVQRVE